MAKRTVEDSLALDVLQFARKGSLGPDASGYQHWRRGGSPAGSISWQIQDECLWLSYDLPAGETGDERTHHHYAVEITYTPTSFKGRRAWFLCPSCGKRARRLYLPPASTYFLCRSCHNLTYRSRQRRRSPLEKDTARWEKLRQELGNATLGSGRWRRAYEEAEKLLATMNETDFLGDLRERLPEGLPQAQETEEPPPTRPRGRPKVKRPYRRRTPFLSGERQSDQEGVCLRCRAWRELQDARPVTLAYGRSALKGTCPVCHARMTLIVKGS